MSASRALQKAIADRLTDAGVATPLHIGKVPSGGDFPYLSIRAIVAETDDANCVASRIFTISFDVWGRGSFTETQGIIDAVYDAVHEQSLTMDDPFAEAGCRVPRHRIMDEPDGLTWHGMLDIEVHVETVA